MPNLDGGDIDAARAKARFNVEQLLPLVEQGFPVIVPGPTCSYTIKKEWPELLGTPEAKKVAASTFEAMEFMERLRRDKTLVKDFTKGYGKVAYHAACHLRAQKIGTPGARILGLLPDTEVDIVEKCSAVDGTWGMKAQHYEMGRKYAQKLDARHRERRGQARRDRLPALRAAHPAGERRDAATPDGSARRRLRPHLTDRRSVHEARSNAARSSGLAEYEAIREPFRARVIAEKKARRVALGPNASCVFENRDTALMQIQEMLRTERITRERRDRSTRSRRTTSSSRATTSSRRPC